MKPFFEVINKKYNIWLRIHNSEVNWPKTNPHWHKSIELLRIVDGKCVFKVGQNIYTASKGDLIFINSGEIHEYYFDYGNCKIDTCVFDPMILYNLHENLCTIHTHIKYEDLKRFSIDSKISECFDMLYKEQNCMDNSSGMLFQSLLVHIYALLMRYFEKSEHLTHTSLSGLINSQKVLEYISEHYTENITLKTLAKNFNYSTKHISRLLQMRAGISFKEYLDNIRITKALELLGSTDMSITEISITCGYENIRTFNNVFKKITGMTPSQVKDVPNFPL